MPIAQADIDFHLSGGGANADPNASLGGTISGTQITDATVANLFDNVSGAESSAGDTEYRCFYLKNAHASLTWQGVNVWIGTNTPSADTDVEIGLDPAGVGEGSTTGVAATVADESTAPAGVTFSKPASGSPLNVGDIPAGSAIAVWVKRTVSAGASAYNADSVIIEAQGETAA
jgi:hypothetical protein